MNYTKNNTKPVLEVYYGKSQAMKDCEVILDKICDIVKSSHAPSQKKTLSMIDKVSRILQKDLNIGFLHITLQDGPTMNAFTIPSAFAGISKKDMLNAKRIDSSIVKCNVVVYNTLIRYANLNGGELLAIILHEIGHCFEHSFRFFLSRIPILLVGDPLAIPYRIGSFIYQATYMRTLMRLVAGPMDKLNSFITSLPVVRELTQLVSWLDSQMPKLAPMRFLGTVISAPMIWPVLMSSGYIGAMSEYYADSFAVSYGYGPELSRALDKMDYTPGRGFIKSALNGNGFNAFFFDFLEFNARHAIYLFSFDEHPIAADRIRANLKKLKRELANQDLHPEMKMLILEDIKDTEDLIAKMVDPEYRVNRVFINRYLSNKAILQSTNGKTTLYDLINLEKVQD